MATMSPSDYLEMQLDGFEPMLGSVKGSLFTEAQEGGRAAEAELWKDYQPLLSAKLAEIKALYKEGGDDVKHLGSRIDKCQSELDKISKDRVGVVTTALTARRSRLQSSVAQRGDRCQASYSQTMTTVGATGSADVGVVDERYSGSNACAITATEGALSMLRGDALNAAGTTSRGVTRYATIVHNCRERGIDFNKHQNLEWSVDALPFYTNVESGAPIRVAFDQYEVPELHYRRALEALIPEGDGEARRSCVAQIGGYYFSICAQRDAAGRVTFRIFDSHGSSGRVVGRDGENGAFFSEALSLEDAADFIKIIYPSPVIGLELFPLRFRGGGGGAGGAEGFEEVPPEAVFTTIRENEARRQAHVSGRSAAETDSAIAAINAGYHSSLHQLGELIVTSDDFGALTTYINSKFATNDAAQMRLLSLGLMGDGSVICRNTEDALLLREVLQVTISGEEVSDTALRARVAAILAPPPPSYDEVVGGCGDKPAADVGGAVGKGSTRADYDKSIAAQLTAFATREKMTRPMVLEFDATLKRIADIDPEYIDQCKIYYQTADPQLRDQIIALATLFGDLGHIDPAVADAVIAKVSPKK